MPSKPPPRFVTESPDDRALLCTILLDSLKEDLDDLVPLYSDYSFLSETCRADLVEQGFVVNTGTREMPARDGSPAYTDECFALTKKGMALAYSVIAAARAVFCA